MISQRTALAIADTYAAIFVREPPKKTPFEEALFEHIRDAPPQVDAVGLRDYLLQHNYQPWLYHKAQALRGQPIVLKNLIIGLYDGTSLVDVMPTNSWEERQNLGRQHLWALARDVLNLKTDRSALTRRIDSRWIDYLKRTLELDGYTYRDRNLIRAEQGVLDTHEESGTLMRLFDDLGLDNREATKKALDLAQEHYLAGRWEDAIGNARKVFESILREVAIVHSERCLSTPWPDKDGYIEPGKIRDYLRAKGLLMAKEKEAIASLYQLLSNKGSHPSIAQQDQARLLTQLALVLSQFVMVRLQGILNGKGLKDSSEDET